MAEEAPRAVPNAPFPAPPPFWKAFTTSNIAKLKELESTQAEDSTQLPVELTFLTPPSPPPATATTYPVFLQPTPLTDDIPLPPTPLFDYLSPAIGLPHNAPALLMKITKSLLLNFLEFTTIMARNPSAYDQKVADVRTLFENAHFLINAYRPHQAREGLIGMLEDVLDEGWAEIRRLEQWETRVRQFLEKVERAGLQAETEVATTAEAQRPAERQLGADGDVMVAAEKKDKPELDETNSLWKKIREIDFE